MAVFSTLIERLSAQLIGRSALIERLVISLLCDGHILLEGAPGLAKTRAIKLFADAIDTQFARIQATPDLLPADLTGTTVYRQQDSRFEFMPGPLFNHVILVDEINRAPPKVQSALLEAMAEKQITVAGTTHRLPSPFLVAATQNPIEHEGTFALPEAQLDRFLFFVELGLPDAQEERRILDLLLSEDAAQNLTGQVLVTHDALRQAAVEIQAVHISEAVRDYIVRLVDATRGGGPGGRHAVHIEHPASPRASIGMARAARAKAWLDGRDHVLPTDVSDLCADILTGRIGLNYQARASGISTRSVVLDILNDTTIT
ncbi:AAA family ATPase [Granulosicoccaceae sp. 1_MG-2023]|nr:AAA family ATPase [Granulosicoccaceae sp. 1_MG-2023]